MEKVEEKNLASICIYLHEEERELLSLFSGVSLLCEVLW